MAEEERKTCWLIPVRQERELKVIFEEPLTMQEALDAFCDDEYEDIIDEDVLSTEVTMQKAR